MKKLVVFSIFCIVLSLIISFCSILYVNNNQINKEDIENTINNALNNYNTNQHISNEDIDRIVEKVIVELETSKSNDEILDKLDEVLSNENGVSNIYYDFITNNNSYIETIHTIEESKDKDKEKEIKNDLILSEDTIYELGMPINITAIEDETYVYAVKMYTEYIILSFPDYIDINTINVNLYASLDKTGKGIMNIEDNSFVSSEAIEGIYYIEITGLPAGKHEIGVGY